MICILTVYDSEGKFVSQVVSEIKNGDNQLREKFIEDYIPFIIKTILKTVPNQKDLKNCDEYSVGLIAFNEAIDKFDKSKSPKAFNFFSFAEMIIKRRIIDYLRLTSKKINEIPFSYINDYENDFEQKYLADVSTHHLERLDLFEEIKHFENELKSFHIKISELHKYTPKHKDSRQMCISIARQIASNKQIYNKLITKKYFPMKEISQIVSVHPRTIERNRNFIISISLIYGNGYEHLQSYLGNTVYGGNIK